MNHGPAFVELVGGRHDGARVNYQGAEVVVTHIEPASRDVVGHVYAFAGDRYVLERVVRGKPAWPSDPRRR